MRTSRRHIVAKVFEKIDMKIILAAPRGFCAGVEMAIESLRMAIEAFPPPIYVYHEIVHNKFVVEKFLPKCRKMDPHWSCDGIKITTKCFKMGVENRCNKSSDIFGSQAG